MLSVGNFTRDSDQILQRHHLAENDPSPSQSEIALVLHEIAKTRECMNAVFDHLDDLCDRLGAFYEKRERDHRVNKDVAISKSTLPTCSFMESMESDYRPLRVNGQHGWRRTLCFHYKAHGHFACECPNLSAPSGADQQAAFHEKSKSTWFCKWQAKGWHWPELHHKVESTWFRPKLHDKTESTWFRKWHGKFQWNLGCAQRC